MFNGGRIRQKLQGNRPVVGTIMYLGAPQFVEIAAEIGYEWLFVDTEHGHIGYNQLFAILLAAKGTPLDIIVRVPGLQESAIKTALDLGASGVVVPMIQNADQVATAVRWSKYAPQGLRGYGPLRADHYLIQADEYRRQANDLITVIAQIESVQAVDAIQEIVRVPGLDGVFMGTDDLSQSMGILGQPEHPALIANINRVFDAAQEARVAYGTFVRRAEQCRPWIERGARLMTISSDMEWWVDGLRDEWAELKRYL